MKKLIYLSNFPVPYHIKYCYALQKYFNTEFWFYSHLKYSNRPDWWKIDLGTSCKILKKVWLKRTGKFITLDVLYNLRRFDPDFIILGGFSIPSNYLAYRWGRHNRKKVIVFTERSRDKNGKLRKKGIVWTIIKYLYKDIDLIITAWDDIVPQFRDEFGFGKKVVAGRYPSDIDNYFFHLDRADRKELNLLFANRLTEIYNPLFAIEVFKLINTKYSNTKLFLNSKGELLEECINLIESLKISDKVQFISDIEKWDDLPGIYEKTDILILPATFSNGNFTIFEAMASGMGIVISDKVYGNGDLITDEINGFKAQLDITTFTEKVERYFKDRSLFTEHANLNKEIVKPLSIQGTAEFLSNLLKVNLQ